MSDKRKLLISYIRSMSGNKKLENQCFTTIGKVIDNEDPSHQRKITLEVSGLYDRQAELRPWIKPVNDEMTENIGYLVDRDEFEIPELEEYVIVRFPEGYSSPETARYTIFPMKIKDLD